MAIIGISGKKQHGKDTVCKIIQYLMFQKASTTTGSSWSYKAFTEHFSDVTGEYRMSIDQASMWQRKLFADKLKDIVCLLLSCTREQLEDNKFKETELGEEWDKIIHVIPSQGDRIVQMRYKDSIDKIVKMTPRLLLQLIGTECGRNTIHPNIWVNALMGEYIEQFIDVDKDDNDIMEYPNWIITDVRFPNELKAIEDKGGVVLRINNPRIISTDTHPSETSLDNVMWPANINIYNDGSIEDLVDKVRIILERINLL